MKSKSLLLLFSVIIFIGAACKSSDEINPEALFVKPENFPAPVYDLTKNPITQAGFDLGKELFLMEIYREMALFLVPIVITKHTLLRITGMTSAMALTIVKDSEMHLPYKILPSRKSFFGMVVYLIWIYFP